MARRKRVSNFRKFTIISTALIAVQILFIAVYGGSSTSNPMEEITKRVDQMQNLNSARREQMKVQLAVADFISRNKGATPQSLQELVPLYFKVVPVDPSTNQPFAYKLENGKPMIGISTTTKVSSATTKGGGTNDVVSSESGLTEKQQLALIASLTEPINSQKLLYDPTGKRDPFRPFDKTPNLDSDEEKKKTDLERMELGQLKLTAVLLQGVDEPKAIVEDQSGKGYTVKKGTRIGTNNGEIVDILQGKLVILETTFDFTGEKKTRTAELSLHTKDQGDGKGGNSRSGRARDYR